VRDVTIIGGGAAGTLLLAQLARLRGGADVAVVEPGTLGAGVAYGTDDPAHRLNVPAAAMSAWPDRPDHFVEWSAGRAGAASFVSRSTYRAYLASLVPDEVRHLRTSATALLRRGTHWTLRLADGSTVDSAQVVLATGVEAPSVAWAPQRVRRSPRFVADPWAPGALDGIEPDAPVLVVGTGLTGVDVVLTLARTGRRIRAVSRHGLLPAAHPRTPAPPLPLDAGALPHTLPGLRVLIARRILAARARTGDWRPAIDGLRRYTGRIWTALSDADREEFLRHDARRWDVARHRMAPEAGEALRELLRSGRLTVSMVDGPVDHDGWIVNATGPNGDVRRSVHPLTRHLLAAGTIGPGPHRIGIDTTVDGQVRDATRHAVPGLWTLGSSRRGQLWESTAIPEIREQAAALARQLVHHATRPPAPPGRADVSGPPAPATARR